jgi:hypothetical protein
LAGNSQDPLVAIDAHDPAAASDPVPEQGEYPERSAADVGHADARSDADQVKGPEPGRGLSG